MKTINLKSFKEQLPKHGEEIFYFDLRTYGNLYSYDPQYATVEYFYEEIIDNLPTGTTICYDPNDTSELENFIIRIQINNIENNDNEVVEEDEYEKFYYTTVNNLYKILEK